MSVDDEPRLHREVSRAAQVGAPEGDFPRIGRIEDDRLLHPLLELLVDRASIEALPFAYRLTLREEDGLAAEAGNPRLVATCRHLEAADLQRRGNPVEAAAEFGVVAVERRRLARRPRL